MCEKDYWTTTRGAQLKKRRKAKGEEVFFSVSRKRRKAKSDRRKWILTSDSPIRGLAEAEINKEKKCRVCVEPEKMLSVWARSRRVKKCKEKEFETEKSLPKDSSKPINWWVELCNFMFDEAETGGKVFRKIETRRYTRMWIERHYEMEKKHSWDKNVPKAKTNCVIGKNVVAPSPFLLIFMNNNYLLSCRKWIFYLAATASSSLLRLVIRNISRLNAISPWITFDT